MEKTLKILIIAFMLATGFQMAAVNFLPQNADSLDLQNTADLTAMQAAFSLMPLLP